MSTCLDLGGIAKKNMNLLLGEEEGSLNYALRQYPESMGGNAGYWKKYPCIGANFYFDQTGEIIYFGNFQSVPQEIRNRTAHGTFRMAIDLRREQIESIAKGIKVKEPGGICRKIIGTFIDQRPSYTARSVLEETIRRYNVLSSIREEPLIKI